MVDETCDCYALLHRSARALRTRSHLQPRPFLHCSAGRPRRPLSQPLQARPRTSVVSRLAVSCGCRRMVLYFHPIGYGPGKDDNLIYVGKDKHENEDLIKYGLPQDIWFHVSDLSSAHVYLRLPAGQSMDDISQETLDDCIQLVKANSITGNKTNNIDIVYTPWSNLKKTASMEVGQVGFHSNKLVKKVRVEKRINDIVNRLNKTKQELYPDLAAERETYDKGIRAAKKAEVQDFRKAEKAAKDEERRQADLRSYKNVMTADSMSSNKDMAQKYKSAADYEDDFM